jgi:CheY-like chemotaxis protein
VDRILIAEDNAINQKVIERMVQKLGYPVDLVANGREAIDALGGSSYSLVFMDCQMPEMDGFEACREIRKLDGGARIPIIAITANAMKGDRERCLAAGMDDYVSKPFKQEDLRVVIERWLGVSATKKA